MRALRNLSKRLTDQEVSIAPLVTFRIVWGILMGISIIRFGMNGWIKSLYIDPVYYFSFIPGMAPLPGLWMYVIFIFLAIAAAGIAAGFYYRFSATVFFILFTYVELLDKTNYLNHYYFVSLVSFVLIFLPCGSSFSLDVRVRRKRTIKTVPIGYINLLRAQLGLVYFFAGLAKINPDWLFRAQPLKIWLASKGHTPIIGGLFKYTFSAYLFSWFGMIYDLTIPLFLAIRKTLPYAYMAVVTFHLMTWILFPIGMFPFIMIAATTIFFPISFHEKVLVRLGEVFGSRSEGAQFSHPFLACKILLGLFLFIQSILPFRYLLHKGDLFWNESGFRFSWRVMLMEKSGAVHFYIQEGGRKIMVDNREFLTPQQEKMMATQPDMIVQFADFLKNEYKNRGFRNPAVFADSWVSLNGRPSRQFVDPNVDLTSPVVKTSRTNWIVQHD